MLYRILLPLLTKALLWAWIPFKLFGVESVLIPSIGKCRMYLLNFVCGLSTPKRRVVRWRNFAHRRVTTMCRTCAGYRFMSIGVVVTKIMTFFQKCVQVGLHVCSGNFRSVGGTVGSRSITSRLADWLQQHVPLQWRRRRSRVAIWLAQCRSLT